MDYIFTFYSVVPVSNVYNRTSFYWINFVNLESANVFTNFLNWLAGSKFRHQKEHLIAVYLFFPHVTNYIHITQKLTGGEGEVYFCLIGWWKFTVIFSFAVVLYIGNCSDRDHYSHICVFCHWDMSECRRQSRRTKAQLVFTRLAMFELRLFLGCTCPCGVAMHVIKNLIIGWFPLIVAVGNQRGYIGFTAGFTVCHSR